MQISNAQHPKPWQQGFTLIELLVVVVIVAILFTYTTLAIRGDSPEDLIKEEALRFERLVQLAMEEAILRGEEYGLEVYVDGYRFLRLSDNLWQPLSTDKILRSRELSHDMELEMRVEETNIVIDSASNIFAKKPTETTDASANEEEEKAPRRPQIYLLSSGEISPEFDIRFFILGIEASYVVNGAFDGSLKTVLSEL
ncbi:MAG: type II secretion system minor pseudopilin GspH [Gammaproteobacteria bacterium]|nr:type II secretion system minor pseudopilin GspH [Gammaproteobacteria bacterium]